MSENAKDSILQNMLAVEERSSQPAGNENSKKTTSPKPSTPPKKRGRPRNSSKTSQKTVETNVVVSPVHEVTATSGESLEDEENAPIFKPNKGPQTLFLSAPEQEVLYGGAAGGGKRLWTETPITYYNKREKRWLIGVHGDINEGDKVLHPSGASVHVLKKHPVTMSRVWEVEFDNGEVLKADGDHCWRTLTYMERDRPNSPEPISRTTEEIYSTLRARGGSHTNHAIPVSCPVGTPPQDLSLDPYLLGLWLGDGYSHCSKIGMAEADLLEVLVGQEKPDHIKYDKTKLLQGSSPYLAATWFAGSAFGQSLRKYGLLNNKHIPADYFLGSIDQRLSLVQGIMDTDGNCNKNGSSELCMKSEGIVRGVSRLLASLGVKSTVSEKRVKGYPDPYYRIKFTTTLPVFRLGRKKSRLPATTRETTRYHYITSVRKTDDFVPMNCISVNATDGMYLVGSQYVPTRNSYALLADAIRYAMYPDYVGLILRRTNDELRELIQKSHLLYPKAYPGARWRQKQSEWQFPSGARLWFAFLDNDEDVMRYQGQAFAYIGFDELTQYPTPYPWDYLRSRLRTTNPDIPLQMRASSNPGGPGNSWVRKMFIEPSPPNKPFWARSLETGEILRFPKYTRDGKTLHPKSEQPLFQRKFIPASLYDNPYLTMDANYEANLMSLPEVDRRRLLDGDWDVMSGAAFPEFNRKIHSVEPFHIPSGWTRFRSCDYGYGSHSSVLWFAVHPSGQLIVYRELYVTGVTAENLAENILDIEMDYGDRISYGILDSSMWHKRGDTGPSMAEKMIRKGCKWRPSDRSKGSRVSGKNEIHRLLQVDPFLGQPKLIMFNTCIDLLSHLPMLPLDKRNPEDIDTNFVHDHSYDALRYGVMSRPKSRSTLGFGESQAHHSPYQPVDPTFGA